MTSENVELRIPSIMGYEKVAMDFAASTAKKMGFSPDRIEDLKTSVAEACINAIEHGNQMDISTKVDITLTVQDSALEVTVQDRGKGPCRTLRSKSRFRIAAKALGRSRSRTSTKKSKVLNRPEAGACS